MSVAQKIALARRRHPGRPTQSEIAIKLGLNEKSYQSYERGKVTSRRKLEPITWKLAQEYRISPEWFWDGEDTDPFAESQNALADVKVPVYHAPPATLLVTSESRIEMINIDADVAAQMGESKGVELPDDRMSPRFTPGETIFGRPTQRLTIGSMYIASRKPTRPDETETEIVIGVYRVKEGSFFLVPINENFPSVNVLDLKDFAIIIAAQKVLHGNPEWVTVEKLLKNGLPSVTP